MSGYTPCRMVTPRALLASIARQAQYFGWSIHAARIAPPRALSWVRVARGFDWLVGAIGSSRSRIRLAVDSPRPRRPRRCPA
eukprot:124724-Prymnesium_polylepis.1